MKAKAFLFFFATLWSMFTLTLGALLECGPWTSHFAKIKMGMIVVEIRNKLNGHVFSRNRGGAYVRGKVTPLNPNTSFQAAVRSRLAGLSQGWRALTAAQRTAWSQIVEQFATTDIFGDLRNPSGQQLFIRLNSNILNAGGVQISDPPQAVGADAIVIGAYVANTVGPVHTVAFTATPVPANHALIVEATEALSQGIENANSRFRQIEVFAAAQASPADIAATHLAKFGALVAGTKLFVRIRQIRTDTGEVSGRQIANTTVL